MELLLFGAIIFSLWAYSARKESRRNGKRSVGTVKRPDKRPDYKAASKRLNAKQTELAGITLSAEQKKVFDILENTDASAYVTGKAGTGKSLLLEYFVKRTRKKVAVVAPTGIAALNVGGMTINSFFRMPLDVVDPQKLNVDYKTREILRSIDAIVIDEVSMVRADVMEGISAKLKIARRDDRPFGGIQMIMFGDLYQLPPVVTDGQLHRYFNHTYGGIYFFNAPSVENANIQIYELGTIFRQKDPVFRELLNEVRSGKNSRDILAKLNVRASVTIPNSGFVTLAGTNQTVSRIIHKKLGELPGEEKTYTADIWGDIKEASFPTEKYLKLKPGAQIMMLKNDVEQPRRWANGTLGIVTQTGNEVIRVNINGVEHSVKRDTWQKIKYDYDHETRELKKIPVSEFKQFPLRLAWAITIHKSQGQTYQSVAIDLSDGAFAHGQTYVALSRCVSMDSLYLKTTIRPEDIIIDPEVVDFMSQAKVVT